jgi:hypothetical protein
MTDRQTVQAALDDMGRHGGGALEFEPGRTYHLGPISPPNPVFRVRDLHGAELRGNGATLICDTTGSGKTQMFLVQRCTKLRFAGFKGRDLGVNLNQDWKGMDFIHLETTAGPIADISLDSIEVEDAVSLLTCSGTGNEQRATGIRLSNLIARRCYYGLSFQENGDDVSGDLKAINCRRVYFPYGVRRHDVKLDIWHDLISPGADACILIKRYRRDTGDIRVAAHFAGALAWSNLVKLEQQPQGDEIGVIENISLDLEIDPSANDPWDAARLGISAYRSRRHVDRSDDIWRGITLSGCFGPTDKAVIYRTHPERGVGLIVAARDAVCKSD